MKVLVELWDSYSSVSRYFFRIWWINFENSVIKMRLCNISHTFYTVDATEAEGFCLTTVRSVHLKNLTVLNRNLKQRCADSQKTFGNGLINNLKILPIQRIENWLLNYEDIIVPDWSLRWSWCSVIQKISKTLHTVNFL